MRPDFKILLSLDSFAVLTDCIYITGDSVYAKNNSLSGLESALESLSDNTLYRAFRENVEVDGTWDDHDMGVNDGGKHVTLRKERQEMFVKYVTGLKDVLDSTSTPSRTLSSDGVASEVTDLNGEHHSSTDEVIKNIGYTSSQQGIKQDGLYKVMDRRFGANGPLVRFILLDTRSHRDNHYIRSLGEIKLPLTALIAAFIRLTYSVLGLGREHKGNSE